MAAIDLSSISAPLNDGILQLQNGVAMSSTLTSVTDQSNTASTLKLSTTSAQFTSPLRITTDDPSDFYLDCEDGSTNNRFSITRNTASQQVNLNFASNPAGSTTIVGAVRTYVDGTNLSEVMTFREDGNVGVGITNPITNLQVKGTILSGSGSGDTYSSLGSALGNYGGVGSNYYTIGGTYYRTYNDSVSQLYFNGGGFQFRNAVGGAANSSIGFNSQMEVGVGAYGYLTLGTNVSGAISGAKLGIRGDGSTSATTSLLVQNSGGTNTLQLTDDGSLYIGTTVSDLGVIYVPHSPTYGERTFLRMQSGGRQIFATSSNDGLVVKTLGTTFESGITINDGTIVGKSTAVAASVSAYNLPTRIDCISTANSCLINLSGGGRLQGSSDAQYIRIEGTIQIDGASNELKGFYFNPTLTGAFSPQNVLAIHSTYGGAYLNTATPNASAILQADSTTQGFLPPRMTDAEIRAIATPAEGLIAYNTTISHLCCYQAGAWVKFSHSPM